MLPVRAETTTCFTNKVIVLEEARGDELAICRSSAFVEWATRHSTSFGVGGGIQPSLTKGVNTFVAPPSSDELGRLSDLWAAMAHEWCVENAAGQTKLQHAVNDRESDAAGLRALLEEIDVAVLEAYGWAISIWSTGSIGLARASDSHRRLRPGTI